MKKGNKIALRKKNKKTVVIKFEKHLVGVDLVLTLQQENPSERKHQVFGTGDSKRLLWRQHVEYLCVKYPP